LAGLAYSASMICSDVARSVAFYSKVLETDPMEADDDRAFFDVDGSVVELRSSRAQRDLFDLEADQPGGVMPILEVVSEERSLSRLSGSQLNGRVSVRRSSREPRTQIVDPEGNVVELWQRWT